MPSPSGARSSTVRSQEKVAPVVGLSGGCDAFGVEALTKSSGLDWIIVRSGRLTNGPGRKNYVKKVRIEPVPGSISRDDVAHFLGEAAEVTTWVKQSVQIGG